MDLSVVIVSWNVRELLAACLSSVFESLQDSHLAHEVWVVDNASTDDSAGMVRSRFPQVQLIANGQNQGFAAANNQALAVAQGRCVLLLNPDTKAQGDAIRTLFQFIEEHPRVGMAGPRLIYGDGEFQHSAFRFPSLAQVLFDFFPVHHRMLESRWNGRYPRALYSSGRPFAIDHPLGACMMVRAAAVTEIGLMDQAFFMYCEEIDWALRMRHAGWELFCVPAAEIVHYSGRSTRQFTDEMFVSLWRSRLRLFSKHYGKVFNWMARRVVRLGLRQEEARSRRRATAGLLTTSELESRLSAYQRVRELTYA